MSEAAKGAIVRSEHAIAERMLDETVILDPENDSFVRLNRAGSWIWERLAEPATPAELAAGLGEKFGVDEARTAADIAAFLEQLGERGLVSSPSAQG